MSTPARIARRRRLRQRGRAARGALARQLAALVAVCVLAASAGAQVPESGAAMLLPASLQPADWAAGASPATTGDSEIRNRTAGAGAVVGGEQLHGALLRQFYAAHNFEPVWTTRQR